MVDVIKRINKVTQIPGLVPLANLLSEGQIAINMADGKLYIRLLAGNVICVGQDVGAYADAIEGAIDGLDIESYALAAEVAASLASVAQQLQTLATAIAGKAASTHGHGIGEVTGLQTALDGKQPTGNYQPAGSYAAATHGHQISQVDGLQQIINALIADIQTKQPTGNYQPAGSYAAATHGHQISQITGLQTALDGKQPMGNYQPAGSYAAATHSHGIADVTGLQTALDGKAPIAGVTGTFAVGNTFTANVVNSNNHISAATTFRIGTNNVVRSPNQQGWQNPTGPQSTASFNSSAVTLNELARRVAAIQTQLIYHGLLSTQGTTIT